MLRTMQRMRPMGLGLILSACSCGAPSAAAPPSATSGATVPSTDYEVNEWGLLRGTPGDTVTASAIAPPVQTLPIAVDKPVLYFHADAPITLRSVRVHAEGGTIEEHWPPTPLTDIAADVAWFDVGIDPVATCTFSELPTGCPTAAFCEVPSLGTVRAPGAACVRTPGGSDSLLFYRARQAHFTPPLVFERTSVYEEVSVRNEGDEPIPGWLIRLHAQNGSVVALAVPPPGPHESVVVGADFAAAAMAAASMPGTADDESDRPALPGSPAPGRHAVIVTMQDLGLTTTEIDAFLRAWDAQLFGLAPADEDVDRAVDVLSVDGIDGELAPVDSFLYFLPPRATDAVATLTFDPPPRAVHRALAMWSTVATSGPSR